MKKLKRILLTVIAALCCCAFSLAGCSGNTDSNKIRVCEVAHSIFYAPMYVAINMGYFAEEGLEIELTNGSGADKVMSALTSKKPSADIGLMGPEASVYVNIANKKDYPVIFGQLTKRDGSFLVSKKDEADTFKWSDLAGKRLLAGRQGGMPAMTLQYVVEQKGGLNVKTDLNFDMSVSFGLMGQVFKEDATVDYTTLFEPTASDMTLNGFGYIVASVGEESGEVPYTAFSAKKSYIDKNPDKIRAFLRAVQKGYNYLMEASLDEAAAALWASFNTSTINTVKSVITNYKNCEAWNETPVMSEAAFNRLQDIMVNAGELTVSAKQSYTKLVDNTYANEIKAALTPAA